MTRDLLAIEIEHSTTMLRLVFLRYATACACDQACLRDDALFWALNRARCRAMLNNPLNWSN